MKTRNLFGVAIVLLLTLATVSAGCLNQPETTREEIYADQFEAATNLVKNISVQLDSMDNALVTAAEIIANDKHNETLVHQQFGDVYTSHQAVEAFIIIDEHNRIIDVYPTGNSYLTSFVGDIVTGQLQDYSTTPPIITTVTFEYDKRTAMGNVIPMISTEGTYEGVLVAVIDPSLFYEVIVHKFQLETKYNAWIVDENGRILYYPDRLFANDDIMQLKSPDQTELNRVLETILQEKSGVETYTAYSYGKLKLISHIAAWDTVVTRNTKNHDPVVVVTSEIENTPRVTHPAKSANLELQEFMYSAYQFAKQNGKEAALKEFNDPEGAFATKEYYITAFNMNGTLLASPYLPGNVGENWISLTDMNGVPIIQVYNYRVNHGGGYVTNIYPNPLTGNEEVRISYVMPVDEDWYIISGKYYPEINASVPPETRIAMIQYAREIATFVETNGAEEAFARLNSESHKRDEMEMVVASYNGTITVHSFDSTLIGKDMMGITDIYGTSIGRGMVTLAKDGGGFRYINLPVPDGKTKLSLAYAEPINDEHFAMITVPIRIIV